MSVEYETAIYDAMCLNDVNNLQTLINNCAKDKEIISNAYSKAHSNNVALSVATEIFIRKQLVTLRFFEEDANLPKKQQISKEHIQQRINMVIKGVDAIVDEFSNINDNVNMVIEGADAIVDEFSNVNDKINMVIEGADAIVDEFSNVNDKVNMVIEGADAIVDEFSNVNDKVNMVIEGADAIVDEFSNVNDKVLYKLKFLAKNIRVLKLFLKSTYDSLPWEEIEFCVVTFLAWNLPCLKKDANFGLGFGIDRLLRHLRRFSRCLAKEKGNIIGSDIKDLKTRINSTPEEIAAKVVEKFPEFEELYCDYQRLRDLHSLQVISAYINLVLTANSLEMEGKFVILRAFQVIGEHMKSTLETPKLSYVTKKRLIAALPKNTPDIIISLRDSLSHSKLLSKRLNIDWIEADIAKLQNDFRKISAVVDDIIFRNRIRDICCVLDDISKCQSINDIQNSFGRISTPFHTSYSEICSLNIFENLEKLIHELKIKIKKKTALEKDFFKRMKIILDSERLKVNRLQMDFLIAVRVIEHLMRYFVIKDYEKLKLMAKKGPRFINPQKEFSNLKEISKLAIDISNNFVSRKDPEQQYEIKELAWKICYVVEFDMDFVRWINVCKDEICKNPYREESSKNTPKFQRQHNLQLRLGNLKDFLNNKTLNMNSSDQFQSYRNNKMLQAALEMIMLDVVSTLDDSNKFTDNKQFLDLDSPTLIGESLRNHLAHGDALIKVLSVDDCMDTLLNAEELLAVSSNSEESLLNLKKKIGQTVQTNPLQLKDEYARCLQNISLQQEMFTALGDGDLEAAKAVFERGADIRSRNFQLKTALHFASQQHNLDVLKFVLQRNVGIEAKDVDGQSALHVAAAFGRGNILEFLICEKNMIVDDVDGNLQTPLHIAAQKGHDDVVRCLLKHKAKPCLKDKYGYSPVHYAVRNNHINTVISLLEMENHVDDNEAFGGLTALHIAAENGHLELVKLLLDKNANVHLESDRYCTPLHAAMKGNNLDIVSILISRRAKVNARSITSATPLHQAAIYSRKTILDLLIRNGTYVDDIDDVMRCSPLSFAAEHGNLEAVELLLEKKADPTIANKFGMIPLHYAASNGHYDITHLLIRKNTIDSKDCNGCTALHLSSANGYTAIVKLLVEEGANVHLTEMNGCTALHLAAEKGHPDTVKYLVDMNQNLIDKTDLNSFTALHFSCINQHEDVIRVLIENGADVNASGLLGATPFHVALGTGSREIVELFMATDEATYTSTCKGFTPLHLGVLKGDKAVVEYVIEKTNCDINAKSSSGYTPLHVAVQGNHKSLIKLLIDKGSDVNMVDNSNHSPVYYAIKRNYEDIVINLLEASEINDGEKRELLATAIFFGHENIVKKLLKKIKFDFNVAIEKDETLLHLAVRNDHKKIVEMLLTKSSFHEDSNICYVNACSEKGLTPLHVAAIEGHSKIVDVLLENGADRKLKACNHRLAIELAIINDHLDIVKKLKEPETIKGSYEDHRSLLHVAAKAGRLEIAKYLVHDKNYDIDELDKSSHKPVFSAAMSGHKDLVKFFLSLKPEFLHETSLTKETLLHIAASGGHLQVAKYLIEQNLNVNATGGLGTTALFDAMLSNKTSMFKLLLNEGAYVDVPGISGKELSNLLQEVLVKKRCWGTLRVFKMTFELLEATKSNSFPEVVRTIEGEAVVNAKWKNGMTSLHYASWKGYGNIVEFLLKNEADPNITSKSGWTPLHYACKFGQCDIVKQLLSNGAVYNIQSDKGRTPRDCCMLKHVDVVYLLDLIEKCFRTVEANNPENLKDFMNLTDIYMVKAVMNTENRERQNLITFGVQSGFSNMEALKQIFQQDISQDCELAKEYYAHEQYKKSLGIYNRILIRRTEILGSDNLSTLEIKEKIANILSHQLKLVESLKMLEIVFRKRKEILGNDHEDTLRVKSAFAMALYKKHRATKALHALEEIYLKAKHIFEPKHEFLFEIQTHIAIILNMMENYERALNICNEVHEKYVTVVGPNQPKTLIVKGQIGIILNKQGKHKKAFEVLQNVFEAQTDVLGLHHPQTLRTLRETGTVHFSQSNYSEALKIFQEVLKSQYESLEKSHPDILITRNCIANTLQAQDKIVGAFQIYQEDFNKRETIYGANHPEIVDTMRRVDQIKLTINLEISNAHITIFKRYINIGHVSQRRLITLFENTLDCDNNGDSNNSEDIRKSRKVKKVISNLLEHENFFDKEVSFVQFQRQQSNENSFPNMSEYLERKCIEERHCSGFVSSVDSTWRLLKFVKMFSEEEWISSGDPREDQTIFSFLRLINDVQKEKK